MSEEEERRRKIEIDSQVAGAAIAGIGAVQRGDLTSEQVRRMIALDEEYLERLGDIAPGLTE